MRVRNLSIGGWELRGKGEEEGDKIIQWEGGRREKGKKLFRGRVVVKGGKLFCQLCDFVMMKNYV